MPALVSKLITRALNKSIRQSPLFTRILFGVKIPVKSEQVHWDFTTLVLKDSLRSALKDGMKVLEMGTGSYGILSIYLSRFFRCKFVACDINTSHVSNAERTAKVNGADVDFVTSDLFSNVTGRFDIIFWNSVYIPRSTGEEIGLPRMSCGETDWCGGETGVEVIDRFLADAPEFMSDGAQIHLGFNPMYLGRETVGMKCKIHGYKVKRVHRVRVNPSCVYILERKK